MKYLHDCIYGGIDGLITTFAIVAGVVGGNLSAKIILILGFANLLADGFSMAASNYLATKAEIEVHKIDLKTRNPLISATSTFIAFIIFGFIPLIPYVFNLDQAFICSIGLAAAVFFLIGAIKSIWLAKAWWYYGCQTFTIGLSAALISYSIGYYVANLV